MAKPYFNPGFYGMRPIWQRWAIYGLVVMILVALGWVYVFKPNTTTANRAYPASSPIRFAVAQAPINLDPRYATDAASARVNRLLYQSLIDFDARFKPIPQLASWQVISNRHYRFTIQGQHVFHDGSPLTAHDVAATYASLLRLTDAPHSAEFSHLKAIRVIDTNTVDFILNTSDDFFVEKLVIGILPAAYITQQHPFNRVPVGSGPLKFVAWQSDLVLSRQMDGQSIVITEVKDPTVRVLKLLRAEVDLLQGDLPPELVRYLSQQKGVRLQSALGTNFSYIGLNMQDPHLRQHSVRQALAHAIDVNAMLQSVLLPHSRMAGVILPPEHYANGQTLNPYAYNPQLAKRLLQNAHIALPLKLVYKTTTDPQRVRFATIMQAQMAPAGIDLEIKSLDWGTFFEDVKKGQFQLYGLTWVGINTPDIYLKAFGSAYVPPVGFNRGRLHDHVLDRLLARHDWPAVTHHVHKTLPVIPLWYEGQLLAMRDVLSDYQLKSDGAWDALTHIHYQP